MTVQIEKTRFNLWHLGGIVLAMIMNAATAGGIWVSLTRDVSDLQKQVSETSDTLHQFQADLSATKSLVPPIQFRQEQQTQLGAENKASIAETNKRIDRVVESFGGKLDTVIESINKIATRVEVLGSKLDDANKTDKTVYRTPIFKP